MIMPICKEENRWNRVSQNLIFEIDSDNYYGY